MTRFKLLGAAAILSLMAATPALAQHMIDEPGMFAFTYPMGDLGIGSRPAPNDSHAAILMQSRNGTAPVGARNVRQPRHAGSSK